MKKLLLILSLFALLLSCAKDEGCQPKFDNNKSTEAKVLKQENIYYHPKLETFIYKIEDPYRLSKVKSLYSATRSQDEEITPTHYYLKLYPKNEEEQWAIERIEGVSISYLPYDYIMLSNEQVESQSVTRSTVQDYVEETKYSVTYTDLQSEHGPVEDVTLEMPIMYSVWPSDKPLPEAYDYEIIDYVVLPSNKSNTRSDFEFSPIPGRDSSDFVIIEVPEVTIRGRLLHFDDVLNQNVPIPCVKVVITNGTISQTTWSDSNGIFSFTGKNLNAYSMYIEFRHEYWKVVRGESTYPVQQTLGDVEDRWGIEATLTPYDVVTGVVDIVFNSGLPEYAITRAMAYYYYGDHPIRTWHYTNSGLRIQTLQNSEDSLGAFVYGDTSLVYIKIYNSVIDDTSVTNSMTILHEMGHFTHFGEQDYDSFCITSKFIKESYATYVGWYLTKSYYSNYNFDIMQTLEANVYGGQTWNRVDNSSDPYTPLFVDLFDNYNQHASTNSLRPNDIIDNFSHEIVRQIISQCNDWQSCRNILYTQIGIYYSLQEFNTYFTNYDNLTNMP